MKCVPKTFQKPKTCPKPSLTEGERQQDKGKIPYSFGPLVDFHPLLRLSVQLRPVQFLFAPITSHILFREFVLTVEKVPVVFRWNEKCSKVYIGGSFNDWNSLIPMSMFVILKSIFTIARIQYCISCILSLFPI